MSAFREASVYVRDRFAGVLSETDGGYRFEYDADYLASPDCCAVSLTLPLQEAPYESNVLFPFFDDLIPEGWLLHIVSKNRNDKAGLT